MTKDVDEKTLRAKLLSGARWAVTIRLMSQAFSWLVTLFMVRLLSPGDYGLNSMIEAPVEVLMLFSTLSVDAALIRFGRREPKQLASAFGFLLAMNTLLFSGLFAGAPTIAEYFRETRLTPLIQVSAVVFLLVPFRVIPNALLDMDLDFKLKSQVELQANVVSALISLLLAYYGAGVWALVAAVVLNVTLGAALLAWRRPWFVRPALDLRELRQLLGYGSTILLGGVVAIASGKVFSVFAGPELGAGTLGLYAVAVVFALMPISKVMPIVNQTLFAAFAQLRNQPAMLKTYILRSLEICALAIFPLGIGMASVAEDLVTVVFGPRWNEVAVPLMIFSALTPLRLLNTILNTPLNATGHARLYTGINLVTLSILLGGVHFVLPFGLMGLVYLSSLAVVVTAVVAAGCASRVFGVTFGELVRATATPLLASLAMAAAIALFDRVIQSWPAGYALAANIMLGMVVYLVLVYGLLGDRFAEIRVALLGR